MGNQRQAKKRLPTAKKKEEKSSRERAKSNATGVDEKKSSGRKQVAFSTSESSTTSQDSPTLVDVVELLEDDDGSFEAEVDLENGASLNFEHMYMLTCSHSTDEDLDHDSDKSIKTFNIKYEVPFNNGIRTLNLSSTTPFVDFLKALMTKMMVPAQAIGYIPSFLPKSPKPLPKLLEDEESYSTMIEDIGDYMALCRAKNRGKGVVKPFHIQIVDTSSDGDSKKTKVSVLLVFLQPFLNVPQAKKNELQPALPAETNGEHEHKLMSEIEKQHACSEHKGKACYVRNDGSHYQYTFLDLSLWAMLLVCSHSLLIALSLNPNEAETSRHDHPPP